MKLENKLQKTLTKGIAVIGLSALTSLSGCGHYLLCPAYTNNKELRMKMDSVDMAVNYSKQNYKLN